MMGKSWSHHEMYMSLTDIYVSVSDIYQWQIVLISQPEYVYKKKKSEITGSNHDTDKYVKWLKK